MYYQEKIINGVLMYRTRPDGDWAKFSIEKMSARIVYLEAMVKKLEKLVLNGKAT